MRFLWVIPLLVVAVFNNADTAISTTRRTQRPSSATRTTSSSSATPGTARYSSSTKITARPSSTFRTGRPSSATRTTRPSSATTGTLRSSSTIRITTRPSSPRMSTESSPVRTSTIRSSSTVSSTTSSSRCGVQQVVAYSFPEYLSSPNYPLPYPSDTDCTCTLTSSDATKRVRIVVLDSQLEPEKLCHVDYVKVFDGNSTSSPEIQTWCGTMKPTVQSTGRHLTLKFHSEGGPQIKGFRLKFFQTNGSISCQTSLQADFTTQVLTSPGYPFNYQKNIDCTWTIQTVSNYYKIKIEVMNSSIQPSVGCELSYVNVIDGWSSTGKFCGTDKPTIVSTGSSITLKFHADNSQTYRGINLTYTSGDFTIACGPSYYVATSYLQTLNSPNYPLNYPNNRDCYWTISTPILGQIVVLQSIATHMESSNNCSNDYIEAYNGFSIASPSLGRWCGTTNVTKYSTGKSMAIRFHSDVNIGGTFILSYWAMYAYDLTTTPTTRNPSCGTRQLTAFSSEQYLTSPNYPFNYDNNMDCTWVITASNRYEMVKIVVTDSELEQQSSCSFDYVRVYDGNSSSVNLLQLWCGDMEPIVQSTGNQMIIHFHSDTSNVRKGFKLKYSQTSTSYTCSQRLQATGIPHVLTSPGYPLVPQGFVFCTWTIHTYLTNVKIEVEDLSIRSSSDCYSDYVTVFDGPDTTADNLGSFCGSHTPTFVSGGSHITLQFHLSSSTYHTGIKLKYTGGTFSACGSSDLTAYLTSTILNSPNYPLKYPKNTDCYWRIDTEDTFQTVELNVQTSSMETSPSCQHDYLEAFDGYDDTSSSLGKWCGSSVPFKYSTGQYMYLKFHSDSSVGGTFTIDYSSEDSDNTDNTYSYYYSTGAIAGGTIGSIIFIVVIIMIIAAATRRNARPAVTRIHDSVQPGSVQFVNNGRLESTVTPVGFQPPPSYSQVNQQSGGQTNPGFVGFRTYEQPSTKTPGVKNQSAAFSPGVTSDTASIVNN